MNKQQLRRRSIAAISGAVLALVAVACSSSSSSSGSGSGDNTVELVYDWPTVDFEAVPIVVGQVKGFYKDEGINVDLVLPPNNATTVKMLAADKGDIGFTTTTDVVFAHDAQIPIKSIGNYSQSNNWGLLAAPGGKIDLSDLEGKSIGVFTDSWTKAMMPYVLKAAGVKSSQVKQVIFNSDDIAPLLAGKIDLTTNTLNYAIAQVKSSTGKRPTTKLATSFGAPNVPIWVYAAKDSWLQSHGSQARAFLAGTKKALAWSIKHPQKAVDEFIKAYPKNGFSKKYNLYGWKSTIPAIKGDDGLLVQRASQWKQVVEALEAVGLLKKSDSPSAYYTNEYLQK